MDPADSSYWGAVELLRLLRVETWLDDLAGQSYFQSLREVQVFGFKENSVGEFLGVGQEACRSSTRLAGSVSDSHADFILRRASCRICSMRISFSR